MAFRFFCGDGGFSINTASNYQPSLSISQRENAVLSRIEALVGGGVYYDKSWDGWVWWIDARFGPHIFDYFQRFSIRNPVKQARMKSIIRLMGYLERGLHKDPGSQARLHHFVCVFQKKENKNNKIKRKSMTFALLSFLEFKNSKCFAPRSLYFNSSWFWNC